MLAMQRVDEAAASRAVDQDPASRDELVGTHLALVEHIVSRVTARFPRGVDRDELVQVALVGLVEAAGRFDPTRGIAFSTYAGRRVEGAILDGLRAACWAPRSVRSNQRQIEAAEVRLHDRLRRRPTECELAQELGVAAGQLARWRASAAKSALVSLDAEVAGSPTGDLGPTMAEPPPSTEDLVENRELRDRVRSCLSLLSERHRYVVVGHLLEDRPMHELAEQLGVTRSRASQLKTEAIHLLRLAVHSDAPGRNRSECANQGGN